MVSWQKPPDATTANIEPTLPEESPNRFEANAKAGETFGSAMGHMVGKPGKTYPSSAEIETLAKTAAVDAGSTVNDFVFTGAFKRAFASGFREGR